MGASFYNALIICILVMQNQLVQTRTKIKLDMFKQVWLIIYTRNLFKQDKAIKGRQNKSRQNNRQVTHM